MPKGYVIARVTVTNPEAYAEYAKGATEAIRQYGGRPLVRGGAYEALEGPARARNVVIEFDSVEQAKLDADPAYQAATKVVEDAKASVASGENAKKLETLRAELGQAMREDQTKDLNLRFVKSELEEWRYFYDDAKHHHKPLDDIQRGIDERLALQAEREKIYAESQAKIAKLEADIKAAGKSIDLHIYPGVDHAFFNDTRPDVYNREAATDAWNRTTEFLRRNLR